MEVVAVYTRELTSSVVSKTEFGEEHRNRLCLPGGSVRFPISGHRGDPTARFEGGWHFGRVKRCIHTSSDTGWS